MSGGGALSLIREALRACKVVKLFSQEAGSEEANKFDYIPSFKCRHSVLDTKSQSLSKENPSRTSLGKGNSIDNELVIAEQVRNDENSLTSSLPALHKSVAFTLAEVLITLGIIGVVATMTIPTLIQNYRSQVLKSHFKKAYSSISQAVEYAKYESGIPDLAEYCIKYQSPVGGSQYGNYYNTYECKSLILKQFNTTGKRCSYDKVFTYSKSKDNAHIDIGATQTPSYLLADGTCVDVTVNASTLGLTVDINGSKKGPNALGHDIFAFWVMKSNGALAPIKPDGSYLDDDDLKNSYDNCGISDGQMNSCTSAAEQSGRPCTKNSNQRGNGLGCSWFAINDMCPDDATKGYWECLPR